MFHIYTKKCKLQVKAINRNKLAYMSCKIQICNQQKKMGNGVMFNQQFKFRNVKYVIEEVQ